MLQIQQVTEVIGGHIVTHLFDIDLRLIFLRFC
jgi:hypothetical protein